MNKQVEVIGKLKEVASKHPYYRYNSMWSREMQNAVWRPARQLPNGVLKSNRASLLSFGLGSTAICRTTMDKRESFSQLRRWARYSRVSSAVIMRGLIVQHTDASPVPVSLKTQGSYISQCLSPIWIKV